MWGTASMAPSDRLLCAGTKMGGWIWDTWYPIFGYDMYVCFTQIPQYMNMSYDR